MIPASQARARPATRTGLAIVCPRVGAVATMLATDVAVGAGPDAFVATGAGVGSSSARVKMRGAAQSARREAGTKALRDRRTMTVPEHERPELRIHLG